MLDRTKPYGERCGALKDRIKYEQNGKFFDSSGQEVFDELTVKQTTGETDLIPTVEAKRRGRPTRKAKNVGN